MAENSLLMERLHFVKGLDPVADAFDGTKFSDVVSTRGAEKVLFVVHVGVATGGTANATLTVQACDDVVPSNRTAVPFKYRKATTGDTFGAITDAAAAGFVMTVGSSQIYLIEVDAAQAHTAGGYANPFVQLKSVEGENDPVVASVLIILGDRSHPGAGVPATAIV
jgi:hypothetical protein